MRHPIARALSLRCPSCGAGRLSRAWWSVLDVRDRCDACALPFMPGTGEFTGAIEITLYGSAVMGLVGVVVLMPAPLWEIVAWIAGMGVALPIVAYRHAKALWIGVMFRARPWGATGDPPHVAPVERTDSVWDAPP